MGRKANCSYFIKYPVPNFFLLKNQNNKKTPPPALVCSEFQAYVAGKLF